MNAAADTLDVSLESVIRTGDLRQRVPRAPDFKAQSEALETLARALAQAPRTILTTLCEVAQKVCHAGSAGVSLLSTQDAGQTFWWPVITGEWRQYVGGGTPRNFGPCGIVLDRDSTQLLARPERYYPYIRGISPLIEEVLLAPFHIDGKAVGTVWVLSHDPRRPFDPEDQRQLESIAQFAAAAHQVLESLDALEERSRELQKADRRKDEFLAMLAHELRNPLAPIRNGVRILQQNPGAERLPALSAMLQRQVDHMVRLIDDLLDVSRVSTGKIQLRRERVELSGVLRQAIETNRPLCDQLAHQLTLTLPGRPIYLEADVTRLTQIVGNLLNNACKFTNPGGRIAVEAELVDAGVVVRVRDSGIGISAEQLPRIFELFAQADTSLERVEGGLGIGLTLVKRLVELHDGTVTAHSAGLGQGTAIVLRLPTLPELASSETVDANPARVAAASTRVLIVDDNRDAAESLAMLLGLDGHVTRLAFDGIAALKAIDDGFGPDVVLLDIGLPGMNGYEVARAIRADAGRASIWLVALTGWGQDEDRMRSRDAGFDAHCVKPLDDEALRAVVTGRRGQPQPPAPAG